MRIPSGRGPDVASSPIRSATGGTRYPRAPDERAGDHAEVVTLLDSKLLEILACPKCRGGLSHVREPESLDCAACGLRYRVEDDIPIMLIEEATALDPRSDIPNEDGASS